MSNQYEVVRPWHGVKSGQIIEIKGKVPPILRTRVNKVAGLVPAVAPEPKTKRRSKKRKEE